MRNNWVGATLVAHGEAEASPTRGVSCAMIYIATYRNRHPFSIRSLRGHIDRGNLIGKGEIASVPSQRQFLNRNLGDAPDPRIVRPSVW